MLAPLCAAAAFVPLIVFLRARPLDPAVAQFWHGPQTDYDFFSYYKAMAIVALAAMAPLAAFVGRRRVAGIALPSTPALAGASLYVVLALASTIASPFPLIAWTGFVERYEGFWVVAAYAVLALTAFASAGTPRRLNTIVCCVLWSALVISVIGLLQLAGLDPFRTRIGRAATIPPSLHTLLDAVRFRLPEGAIYSTLGHYNYVGSYTALVLPLVVALAAGPPTRLRTLSRIAIVPLVIAWAACGSRAGLLGGSLAAAVLLAAWRGVLWTHKWKVVAAAAAALGLIAIARPQVFGRAAARAQAVVANWRAPMGEAERIRSESLPVRAASLVDNHVRLETRGGPLILMNRNGSLSVSDGTGRLLKVLVEPTSQRVTIEDERFSGIELLHGTLHGQPAVVVRQGEFALRFQLTPSGLEYISGSGRALPLTPVEAWGGAGHEDAGSARVYIWSRSLPLMRKTLLIGYGPDTFAAVFPQHDFAGKYLAYGTSEMLVDKPHNLYIQTGLATGVVSVVLLMAFFGAYVRRSWRVYSHGVPNDTPALIGLGCFAGIVGYLGAGLFNDSVVSVAPVFWVLLGAGWRAGALIGLDARQSRAGLSRQRSAAT